MLAYLVDIYAPGMIRKNKLAPVERSAKQNAILTAWP